ncbi:MAG: DUF202 domain-containing protein [Candidatus Bathyarchaeota archaeon]|nr:DUF202 domain-containing protein [Candidatus Bathyarchaeota archaeon]
MESGKKDEQEILARIRTLLALERNYLAEERTELAKFRTGLSLAVIGPSASAFLIYIFSVFPIVERTLFDLINIVFFSIVTVAGLWLCLSAQRRLNKIKQKKKSLRLKESEIVKSSKATKDLLGDYLNS